MRLLSWVLNHRRSHAVQQVLSRPVMWLAQTVVVCWLQRRVPQWRAWLYRDLVYRSPPISAFCGWMLIVAIGASSAVLSGSLTRLISVFALFLVGIAPVVVNRGFQLEV